MGVICMPTERASEPRAGEHEYGGYLELDFRNQATIVWIYCPHMRQVGAFHLIHYREKYIFSIVGIQHSRSALMINHDHHGISVRLEDWDNQISVMSE